MALVSSFLATPAGAVPLAYVRSGGGIAIVDTDAGVTRKIVPWNRVDGPHGAFAISGPPLAVRGRMVFPYAVTGNGSRSWTSYLLSLDPDSNSATDVPVPGDVAGAGSFQTALFTVAVAPTHDAVYLTGTLTRADGSSSPAVLGYDVASGATHVVASAGVCDAGAHGSCSSCPCGPLIDFLPAPDGTRVYVLRDPNPGSFVRHVELAIVDAASGAISATTDLGEVASGIDRGSARFVSLVDDRLLIAVHTEPLPMGSSRVVAIDTASGEVTESLIVPADLPTFATDPQGERLYGVSESTLFVVAARPLATLDSIPLPRAATSLPGVSPDGSRVAFTAIVSGSTEEAPEFHLVTVDVVGRRVVSDVSLPFATGFSGDAPVFLDGCADADRCFCSAAADCALFPCTRGSCAGAEGCVYVDRTCFDRILCSFPLPTFGVDQACPRFRARLKRLQDRAEAALRQGVALPPGTSRRKWVAAVIRAERAMKRVTAAEQAERVARPACIDDDEVNGHRGVLVEIRQLQQHPGTCPRTGG